MARVEQQARMPSHEDEQQLVTMPLTAVQVLGGHGGAEAAKAITAQRLCHVVILSPTLNPKPLPTSTLDAEEHGRGTVGRGCCLPGAAMSP